jgi:hypothetical protein
VFTEIARYFKFRHPARESHGSSIRLKPGALRRPVIAMESEAASTRISVA